MQGTDERIVLSNESRCCIIVELYLEVEDAEIESGLVNLKSPS